MGSFAYTCALSDLPIECGDECRIVALVPSRLGLNGGACSSMQLVFPAVKGVYDDYGFVENLKPTAFQEQLVKAIGHASVQEFVESLREAADSDDENPRLGARMVFSLVREDAWAQMLSMPSSMHDDGYPKQDAQAFMAQACAEGAPLFAKAPEMLEKDKAGSNWVEGIKKAEMDEGKEPKDELLFASEVLMTYCMPLEMKKAPVFKRALGYCMDGFNQIYQGVSLGAAFVLWSLLGASHEQLKSGLDEIGEQVLVNMNMNMLRKVWLERDSSGPQCGEHALHWLWAQKLGELSKAQVDWNDEENGNYIDGFKQAKALMFKEELKSEIPQAAPKASAPKGL